jgi:hypothetical protein
MLRRWGLAIVGLVPLSALTYWGYCELRIYAAERRYSQEFATGMPRREIERRLKAERVPYWPERDSVSIPLGEEMNYTLVCGPTRAVLTLEFSGSGSSGDDVLVSKRQRRLAGACL